eukprot:142364_1
MDLFQSFAVLILYALILLINGEMDWTLTDYTLPQARARAPFATISNTEMYIFGGNNANYYWNVDTPYFWREISATFPYYIGCYSQQCAVANKDKTEIYIADHEHEKISIFHVLTENFTLDSMSIINAGRPAGILGSCMDADFIDNGNSLFFVGGQTHKLLQIYNTTNNSWTSTEIPYVSTNYGYVSCKYYDGTLWIFGGYDWSQKSNGPFDKILRYDVIRKQWSSIGLNIPTPLRIKSSAILGDDNYIYIIGGSATESFSTTYFNSVYRFNPDSSSLSIELVNSMNIPRRSFAAAILNRNVYVFGGYTTGGTAIDSIEIGNLTVPAINSVDFEGISTSWDFSLYMPYYIPPIVSVSIEFS